MYLFMHVRIGMKPISLTIHKTKKHIPRTLIQETSKPTGTVTDAVFSLTYFESNINEVEWHKIHNHVLQI